MIVASGSPEVAGSHAFDFVTPGRVSLAIAQAVVGAPGHTFYMISNVITSFAGSLAVAFRVTADYLRLRPLRYGGQLCVINKRSDVHVVKLTSRPSSNRRYIGVKEKEIRTHCSAELHQCCAVTGIALDSYLAASVHVNAIDYYASVRHTVDAFDHVI
jgi:hypothetical protein